MIVKAGSSKVLEPEVQARIDSPQDPPILPSLSFFPPFLSSTKTGYATTPTIRKGTGTGSAGNLRRLSLPPSPFPLPFFFFPLLLYMKRVRVSGRFFPCPPLSLPPFAPQATKLRMEAISLPHLPFRHLPERADLFPSLFFSFFPRNRQGRPMERAARRRTGAGGEARR